MLFLIQPGKERIFLHLYLVSIHRGHRRHRLLAPWHKLSPQFWPKRGHFYCVQPCRDGRLAPNRGITMKAVFLSASFDFDSPFLWMEGNLGHLPPLGTKVQPVQFYSSLHIFQNCCIIRQDVSNIARAIFAQKPHGVDVYCESVMNDYLQRIPKPLTQTVTMMKRFDY